MPAMTAMGRAGSKSAGRKREAGAMVGIVPGDGAGLKPALGCLRPRATA